MRLPATILNPARACSLGSAQGFTLPEMMIALTVFLLVIIGIVTANLFGLRMFQVNESKLNATEWSRKVFGRITDEVHFCDTVHIGNMTNSAFAGLLDGDPQQGSSLLIYPTTNTTKYILYYVNPSDQTFRRATEEAGTATILADSVTNELAFSAQDFSGILLTNSLNSRVIHLKLEFYQPKRFMLQPDYYKLETSMTRRAIH